MERVKIGKLEAARRQLVEAVFLYAHRRDSFAVMMLAENATEIVEAVARHRGRTDILTGRRLLRLLSSSEKFGELIKRWNERRNFFKHADRDPDGAIEIAPEIGPLVLLDACQAYDQLTGDPVSELRAFALSFLVAHPEYRGDVAGTPWERLLGSADPSMGSPEALADFLWGPEATRSAITPGR